MKDITILGKTYQYETGYDSGEMYDYHYTKFYYGVKIVRYRKFLLFGPVIKKAKPKFFLELGYNIESIKTSKNELRKKLENDFTKHIDLLNRTEEIKKGDLI